MIKVEFLRALPRPIDMRITLGAVRNIILGSSFHSFDMRGLSNHVDQRTAFNWIGSLHVELKMHVACFFARFK